MVTCPVRCAITEWGVFVDFFLISPYNVITGCSEPSTQKALFDEYGDNELNYIDYAAIDDYENAIKELARLGEITVDNTVTGKITKI